MNKFTSFTPTFPLNLPLSPLSSLFILRQSFSWYLFFINLISCNDLYIKQHQIIEQSDWREKFTCSTCQYDSDVFTPCTAQHNCQLSDWYHLFKPIYLGSWSCVSGYRIHCNHYFLTALNLRKKKERELKEIISSQKEQKKTKKRVKRNNSLKLSLLIDYSNENWNQDGIIIFKVYRNPLLWKYHNGGQCPRNLVHDK